MAKSTLMQPGNAESYKYTARNLAAKNLHVYRPERLYILTWRSSQSFRLRHISLPLAASCALHGYFFYRKNPAMAADSKSLSTSYSACGRILQEGDKLLTGQAGTKKVKIRVARLSRRR